MKLFTFWSFAPLGYIERLCLRSMLEAGHAVDLYTYDRDLSEPGVTVLDAADVLPRARAKEDRAAITSNLFRYAGLQRGLGTWIDTDVLLLRSIADMGDHIFGWQDPTTINTAVLRLPPDSAFFAYIDRLVNARVPIDPRWRLWHRIRQYARASIRRQRRIEELRWGVMGPAALTDYCRRSGLLPRAQPIDVFYPVHWGRATDLFDPAAGLQACVTRNTRAVHLWNNRILEQKRHPPPEGSFIARLCKRYGIETDPALPAPAPSRHAHAPRASQSSR